MGIASGNAAFDAAALASESQRQSDLGSDRVQDHSFPPVTGKVSVFAPPVGAAAVRQIDIRHFQRLVAAANQYGISPAPYIQALQALGTGGV
jgi:hypothetical protein